MKQPVRLLLLIPHLGGGGAERVAAQLARHLGPERFEVHLGLIAQDFPGAEPPPASVQVHRLSCERVRRAGPALLRLARAIQPDVLLSGMAHLNFLVLLLKPLLPRHTRILVRQNTTASAAATSPWTRLAYRFLYPRADGILCQTQAMADDLAERFAIARDKLIVLANPIDLPAKSDEPAPRNSLWPEHAWPRLLAVGRLSPEKGIDLLLRAMPRVVERFPDAHAVVLGAGPEAASLRALVSELGLEQSVTLAGHRDGLTAIRADATLFVQPSRYEGMPNALLEAAAAGLPLVATPCSKGVCDLLQGAPGTWLAPAITSQSLAETIVEALTALGRQDTEPRRFQHDFLAPFATPTAISAYGDLLERFAVKTRPTHIAMVIPTIDAIGGAERQVILLATELAARGYSATIVALSGTGTAEREALSKAGVAYLSLGMRKAWIDPRGWLRYLLWVRHHRPDIVHAHIPHATWFARWVRLIAPVRAQVDTLHTSNTGGKARRIGYRLSGFLSDGMTCVSAAVADAAAGMGVALREDLKIVPNGVPIADLGPDQDLGDGPALPSRPFRWIAVGRLAPVKDYATLLRAFAILPAEPQLQIVGSGPEEGSLRSLVAQLGIEGRVDFAGFQREIDPLLRAADAFVLASLWEGLPVGVLEAGAAGLPVVATDAAGTREALLPGETGFLVPVGNPAALSEAMATVMAMPDDRRRTMGNRGRQFVQERFSLSVVADQWERLYADLLQCHPEPARFGWRMPHRRPSLWNRILSKRRA